MKSGRGLADRVPGEPAADQPGARDRAEPSFPEGTNASETGEAGGPDLADLASLLLSRLRAAGVAADPRGAVALTAAMPGVLAAPGDRRSRLYWTARITLVHGAADLSTFDRIFEDLVGSGPGRLPAPGTPPLVRRPARAHRAVLDTQQMIGVDGGVPWATRERRAAERADGREFPVLLPAPGRGTRATPPAFDDLDEQLLAELAARLRKAVQRRPTRRREVDGDGRLDLRRTAHQWRRTGGEPLHLVRARPLHRPRRLVVVCDVSESMRPYVTAFMHLMRAASLEEGETFAFGTSLTRLSPTLRRRAPVEAAVAKASALVSDRYGGTRIASSLKALIQSHHGELLRGAVVVIASDGWDTDPPEWLAAQMARIARRAHRVVWVNPRASEPGYRPLAGGMAAALPHCDAVLPAATLTDLVDVLDELSSTASRRRLVGTS